MSNEPSDEEILESARNDESIMAHVRTDIRRRKEREEEERTLQNWKHDLDTLASELRDARILNVKIESYRTAIHDDYDEVLITTDKCTFVAHNIYKKVKE